LTRFSADFYIPERITSLADPRYPLIRGVRRDVIDVRE
jgi:hypothetical protein